MKRLVLLIVALTMVCASGAWAQKESRIALVIGNGAYQNADALKNPINDARAMAKVLRDAGFEVILSENATRRALTASLREFSAKLTPGGVGLFYYAGHGMQVRGANYLLPVDAALNSEDELRYETIDVADVLNRFDEARTRLSLVVLDACRDNPFARRFRSTSRGLAQADAPRGTVIAYATAPGDTAADGDGENGLYTTELLKAIVMPGLKLEEVFKRTIDGVARASRNRQTPWVSSSFRGEFYFNAAAAAATPPPPPPVAQPPTFAAEQLELAAWNAIASGNNPAMFELFLKRFPNGVYADFARAKLEEMKAAEARRAQQEARQIAAADETRRAAAAEEARRKADADARQAAADEARRKAEVEEARRKAEAEARRAADEEAKRAATAEEARRRAAAEDEKKSVEGAEAALKLADIDRKRIQAALTAKGFDTLGTDGAFGPRTRQMITNWQRSRSEPTTGFLTATQAALLSQEGQSALARIEDERKKADEERRKAEAERQKAAPVPPPAQQAAAAGAAPPPRPQAPVIVPQAPVEAGARDGSWRVTGCTEGVFNSFSVKGQAISAYLTLLGHDGHFRSDNAIRTAVAGTLLPDGRFTLTYGGAITVKGTISTTAITGTVELPLINKTCPLAGGKR